MASSKQPVYVSAEAVRAILTWPLVIDAVEEALKAVTRSSPDPQDAVRSYADQPPRSLTRNGDESQVLLTMPAFVAGYRLDRRGSDQGAARSSLACKLVTSFAANERQVPPVPNILAHILLFDSQTGRLNCIMEGTQITAWRTAAASVVATRHLYFRRCNLGDVTHGSVKVAIIGCGVQGQSHAFAMCATFPVREIFLWNRTAAKAETLAAQLRREFASIRVQVMATPAEAVADADIICVGTRSPDALVNRAMLKTATPVHVNTVGAGQVHFGEVAQDIYDHAHVYVDSWANAKVELKDLRANIVDEVGGVIVTGKLPPPHAVTLFQSMGMAVEDAIVAQAVKDMLTKRQDDDPK